MYQWAVSRVRPAVVAVGAAGLLGWQNPLAWSQGNSGYTVADLERELPERLKAVRQEAKGITAPRLSIVEFPGPKGSKTGTTSATFQLPKAVDPVPVLGAALQKLPNSEFLSWSDEAGLSFALKDDKGRVNGSLALGRKVIAKGRLRQVDPVYSFSLYRDPVFSEADVEALVNIYSSAVRTAAAAAVATSQATETLNEELSKIGVHVFEPKSEEGRQLQWSDLAGYDDVTARLENLLFVQVEAPEIMDKIIQATRAKPEPARRVSLLLAGPPGTGKTTAAKILAARCEVPLIHLPAEKITSKWYGEEQQNLGKVFDYAESLGGCIIFIDEIEALAPSRSRTAGDDALTTNKTLSVLLRRLEGFDSDSRVSVICATNRPDFVDEALLSRFNSIVHFGLPNATARQSIWGKYAKHLPVKAVAQLVEKSDGFSGRDIKHACENTERHWAVHVAKTKSSQYQPPIDVYLQEVATIREGRSIEV